MGKVFENYIRWFNSKLNKKQLDFDANYSSKTFKKGWFFQLL